MAESVLIILGDGVGGVVAGNALHRRGIYAEPPPAVRMRRPGRVWRVGKAPPEKRILWQWL